VASGKTITPRAWAPFLGRGIAVVSADYSGWGVENSKTFPRPQHDIVECVAWIHENAANYGWDASKLGIVGRSFGAMLGSCVTYGDFGQDPAHRPAAFISSQGMLDWSALAPGKGFFDQFGEPTITQHFGLGITKTGAVMPPRLLFLASGLQVLRKWKKSIPGSPPYPSPPPAYAWAKRIQKDYGEVIDPHDGYFGNELVEILQSKFGDTVSRYIEAPAFDMDDASKWFLSVVA
jgi:hypothetical protein